MTDIAVTILTGGRPELLSKTLGSVLKHSPDVLKNVTILHNGADEGTTRVLDYYLHEFHAEVLTTDSVLPIGEAVTKLAEVVTGSELPWWLHLEDDWECSSDMPHWVSNARGILDKHPATFQVRARHHHEQVLKYHMVTRQPLVWHPTHPDYRLTHDAHYTLNPALTRATVAGVAWPADGERDAQKRLHKAGKREVAQLIPGVFRHIGDHASLRKATNCPP